MEVGGPASRRHGFLARFPWRALLVFALLLTAVRIFLCTSLRVPSGSMEPTLHGDEAFGDELLIFKPFYRLFTPGRFDLVVFERKGQDVKSGDRVAVKRIAATGGESIRIDDGDLFVTPPHGVEHRIVKRYAEFRELLVPLWREPFDAGTSERLLARDPGRVQHEHGAIVLTGAMDERDEAVLDLAADAVRFDDGWLDERGVVHEGKETVRDVLFEIDVEPKDATLCLIFEFTVGNDRLEFTLTPRMPGHAIEITGSTVGDDTTLTASARIRYVEPGTKHRLEFWHVDRQVGFALDGSVELERPVPGDARVLSLAGEVNTVRLRAHHGGARITRFEAWRDLHSSDRDATYARRNDAFDVPEGELFVLGDSSFASVDSRQFGSIPIADLVGAPLFVSAPLRRLRWLR